MYLNIKAGLINNIDNRDFGKNIKMILENFGFLGILGKIDHYYLLLLIILPINDTLISKFPLLLLTIP